MKIGYIRVSTGEQNTMRQELLMQELNVDELYIDKSSGKNTERAELKRMLTGGTDRKISKIQIA